MNRGWFDVRRGGADAPAILFTGAIFSESLKQGEVILKFLLAAFIWLVMSASAYAVTYNVDILLNGGSVQGHIETDGTLGVISADQIVDFSLTVAVGSKSVALTPARGFLYNVQSLLASPSILSFDFNSTMPGFFAGGGYPNTGDGINAQLCLNNTSLSCGVGPVVGVKIVIFDASTGTVSAFVTRDILGTDVIGIAQTPIPTALPLFASGLGAIGLMTWRRKRNANA